MPPLHVLHVAPYYRDAWAYGGIPRVASAQAAGLVRRGAAVTVATTDVRDRARRLHPPLGTREGQAWRFTDHAGAEVVVFPNRSNTLAYRYQLFLPRGFSRYIGNEIASSDVAHIHGCHHLPGAIASRLLRRRRVPYVVQPNGTALRIERRRLAKLVFDSLFGRHLLSSAARVVAVTEAERSRLAAVGVASRRIVVIPNPVCLEEYEAVPSGVEFRAAHSLGSSPVVLYLGQLGPRKRVDLVLRAVATLGDPSIRVVIAGSDMGCEAKLRRLARRLDLESVTTFTGVLVGRQRLAALAAADVAVYPSRDEIFGLVPVESVLCGTPVVVSGDCGCGEVVNQIGGGVVTEHGDASAVARAVRSLLAHPRQGALHAARAATLVRQRFSADAVAERLCSLYDEILDESHGGSNGASSGRR